MKLPGRDLLSQRHLLLIVTFVALPPNVFPAIVMGMDVPHILPLALLNITVGPFTQVHATKKPAPVVEQP